MNDLGFEGDADGAEPPVTVTVLHGGFDRARYALMVPVYVDEEMSGAERFLDRQFGQMLTGWRDLGRYPGTLGTSVFVEPGRDVENCEPVGAYLVGVGSSLALDRRRLRFAVRSALIDRCVRLYPPVGREPNTTGAANDGDADPILVGVSSALLGVRDDETLRVEDSVAGILEGVDDTNRALARFEQEREWTSRVRIRYVEFVDRYADRANLAASAIRHMRAAGQVATSFEGLDAIVVTSGDGEGALPIGATLLEQDRPWRRFLITERQTNDPPSSDNGSSPLVVEVSALGREARADRVTHRIDRASLDALMARVSNDRTNQAALRALRNRLVPYALRTEFLTTAAIQFIVDPATANYPWELLTGTALAPERGEPNGTASVLRIFAEGSNRRLQVERARVGTALVIGAGNVDLEGFGPIPGAVAEAVAVSDTLRASGIEPVTMVDDESPLDVAELNIQLCGDHQVLHIASHGIHVDGDRDATGAVLAKDLRFTEDLVESLPIVPELVVVNSCYNARIGAKPGDSGTFRAGAATPRMAAGLARALMGIGVRAVVAAGWPVGDAAAQRFATTLYEQLTAGRSFGEAVAEARATSAALSETSWAAYQCYGDPTFVLRGRSHEPTLTITPVSVSDLRARLGALRIRAADISRPKPGGGTDDRREQLEETFKGLREWVEGSPYAKDPGVRREVALTARELADFETAAHWYRYFAVIPGRGKAARPAGRHASALDLQQAANCLARSAQSEKDLGRFPEAVALAQGAIDLLPEDESWSILASVHKKWATIEADPKRRDKHVDDAVAAYDQIRSTQPGAYGVENRIQFVAVRDTPRARTLHAKVHRRATTGARTGPQAEPQDVSGVVDAAPPRSIDYWQRAERGDCALSQLMIAKTPKQQTAADSMVESYRDAFRRRSTYSERFSSWDHLRDMWTVLPEGDERKPLLADALTELAKLMGLPGSAAPCSDEAVTGSQGIAAGPTPKRPAAPRQATHRDGNGSLPLPPEDRATSSRAVPPVEREFSNEEERGLMSETWPSPEVAFLDPTYTQANTARWQTAIDEAVHASAVTLEPGSHPDYFTLVGDCPRCGHSDGIAQGLEFEVIRGTPLQVGRFNIDCRCSHRHERRPEGKKGCGWGGPLPVMIQKP